MRPTDPPRNHPPRNHRLWLALTLLLVFGVYARSMWNDFAYDDRHYVKVPSADGAQPNLMVAEWQGLQKYFTSFYGEGAVSGGRGLRPITVMSFCLVHQLFKPVPGPDQPMDRAGPQHIFNIALHLLATYLVYLLVLRLFGSFWPALAAAACFGLHALRSDPVITIVGRAEILALTFGVAGQLFYLAGLDRRGGKRLVFLAGAALCLCCAYGSKESSLAWVVFVPLFSLACGLQRDASAPLASSLKAQILPWLGAALVPAVLFLWLWYPILTTSDFHVPTVNNELVRAEFMVRFLTAVMVLGHALVQVCVPFWLHADYSYQTFVLVEHWYDYRFLASFGLFASMLVGGLLVARRGPALFLAMAAFFGFSFITSNIPMAIETIYGERLMYSPAMSLSFLVAWTTERARAAAGPGLKKILLGVAGIWLVICCIVVIIRCGVWADNRALFEHEAHSQPDSQRMQLAAGRQFRVHGERIGFAGPEGEALRKRWKYYLDRAVGIDDSHPLPLNDLAYYHLDLRDHWLRRGDLERAEAEEQEAEEICLRALGSRHFEKMHGHFLHDQMARIAERRGDLEAQLRHLELACEADPKDPKGCLRLARFYRAMGQPKKALQTVMARLRLEPFADVLRFEALEAALEAKEPRTYEQLMTEGERRHPEGNPHLLIFRGIWLAGRGESRQALDLFQMALPRFVMVPPPSEVWIVLPECLAQIGQRQEALGVLAQHLQNPGLPQGLRRRMETLRSRLSKR